jgi:hypothetical protein
MLELILKAYRTCCCGLVLAETTPRELFAGKSFVKHELLKPQAGMLSKNLHLSFVFDFAEKL